MLRFVVRIQGRIISWGIILGCLILPLNALAANLNGIVSDAKGQPVKDAVVYVLLYGSNSDSYSQKVTVMDQEHKEFIPYVLPVQVGTAVRFPNKDNIRHHVYSISPAKKFELPLYRGTQAAPIVFDRPGVVILGCNIHDWMVSYIYVLDTPYFATTGKDGSAEIRELPEGAYEVRVWHPLLRDPTESTAKRVSLSGKKANVNFTITLKPDWRPRRMPSLEGGHY